MGFSRHGNDRIRKIHETVGIPCSNERPGEVDPIIFHFLHLRDASSAKADAACYAADAACYAADAACHAAEAARKGQAEGYSKDTQRSRKGIAKDSQRTRKGLAT